MSSSRHDISGTYEISSGIRLPKHVFIWILNQTSLNNLDKNPFLPNTFNISAANRNISSCHLKIGYGNIIPNVSYSPSSDYNRVFRDLMNYSYKNDDYASSTLLSIASFKRVYPFLYFDLRFDRETTGSDTQRLVFHYSLTGAPNTNYIIYSLVMNEQEIELYQSSGKLLIRT